MIFKDVRYKVTFKSGSSVTMIGNVLQKIFKQDSDRVLSFTAIEDDFGRNADFVS